MNPIILSGLSIILLAINSLAINIIYQNEKYRVIAENDLIKIPSSDIKNSLSIISKIAEKPAFKVDTCKKNDLKAAIQIKLKINDNGDRIFETPSAVIQFADNNEIRRITPLFSCTDIKIDSILTENELIFKAKEILKQILQAYEKQVETGDYDSIRFNNVGDLNYIYLLCRKKNDILDNRWVEIDISNQGVIKFIKGEIFLKNDTSYKPEISKENALKRIAKEFSVDVSNIDINNIYLSQKRMKSNETHWTWTVSATIIKEGKKQFVFVLLDCVTNELLILN